MKRIMWLTTALGLIWLSQVAHTASWINPPIRYVQNSLTDHDFFFDRIVPLSLNVGRKARNYAIGVHITSDRILTSFNPFRRIIRNETMLSDLYATSLTGRVRLANGNWKYAWIVSHLACGRQIQDLPDEVITKGDLWHGPGKRHCPLHDLLVFRIYNDVTVSTWKTEDYTMALFPDNTETDKRPDLFLTTLALPDEPMGVNFKFCAVVKRRRLEVTYYTEDDHALLDCNEWLPRDWGYFICIRNKNKKTKEVSSGAMLVSKEKLFGVASFVLSRGGESIIVFTDIRPYYDLIYNTCTYSDSEEEPPDSFPGNKDWDIKNDTKLEEP